MRYRHDPRSDAMKNGTFLPVTGALSLLASIAFTGCTDSPEPPAIDLLEVSHFEAMPHRLKESRSVSTAKADVFALNDGVLHINGTGWGYIETPEVYDNFRLVVEYRWGENTHGNRKEKSRDAGVFIHAHDRYGDWPKGAEVQLIEGGSGNVNVLDGKTEVTVTGKFRSLNDTPSAGQFDPSIEETSSLKGKVVKAYCQYRSAEWADQKGFRGTDDVELPVGEWNRLEIVSSNGSLAVQLNGKLVNQIEQLPFQSGAIALQSEEAEWFIRKLDLTPLEK
ncbi:MAG: DUF1080 domain-containing protein [Verrucomicrobiota bacterium]